MMQSGQHFVSVQWVTSVNKKNSYLHAAGVEGVLGASAERQRDLRPALQVTVAPHQAIILFEK